MEKENSKIDRAKFTAIVLAGDRTENDPVALDAGVSCKAIVPICDRPMILRVLDALESSGVINSIVVCGPPPASLDDCPELKQRLEQAIIDWIPNLDSPSKSVESALAKISEDTPVLLTTADHALLRADIVEYFVSNSYKAEASVVLVEYQTIIDKLPEVKRTIIRLSDGGVCGCNLFAFMNNNGRKLVPFWRQVEQSRKRPAKMIAGILGLWGVLLYIVGKLSLENALARISDKLQLQVKAVRLPFAEAGVDVDTVSDRKRVEAILLKSIS